MSTLFKSQNLWSIIEEDIPKEAIDVEKMEKKEKDAKALYLIQQAVDESIFVRIARFTTAKEAWEHIKQEFMGSIRMVLVRRQTFRQKFEVLLMKEEETMQQYITRVVAIVNQIKGLGFELTDEEVVSKVMRSMTEKFNHVITSIEEARDVSKLSLNELSGSLLAHEARLNRFNDKSEDKAFYMKGDSSSCNSSNYAGEAGFRGRSGFRGRGRNFRGKGISYGVTKGNFSKAQQQFSSRQQQFGRVQRLFMRPPYDRRSGRGNFQNN
ncbi:uncharacterized protein LOC120281163 [Dioscorea cayenensis subsp. rotundata]|uniref:Uncharacterized protein LOC120281163 n=1 Tax=Dioscorea cayennensis subsp. rotundata TaxID=55577 RepID=A0AB40D156_DIOCR|nr:uncharacterized protein LOC120281163 [Dioscorea cayenensis subsp. rotundata]